MHFNRLIKIKNDDFLLSRIKNKIERKCFFYLGSGIADYETLIRYLSEKPQEKEKSKKFSPELCIICPIFNWLRKFIPTHKKESEIAGSIIRLTLVNKSFINSITNINPYFGIQILRTDFSELHEFSELFFKSLIKNQESIFYFEISNNLNLSSSHRYFIPEENRLIYTLLKDARFAEHLAVYKPLGDEIIYYLNEMHKKSEDPYNNELDYDFTENGCWKSPVFVVIRFFDIMVSEAIYQNINWHMWLYYYTHFTGKICRNYKLPEDTERKEIRYNLLLSNMISTLISWIEIIKELPQEHENAIKCTTNPDPGSSSNGNPIESSIIALGDCIRDILLTKKILDSFKNEIVSSVFRLYVDIRKIKGRENYAELLLNSLAWGGSYKTKESAYLGSIIKYIAEGDNIAHYEVATETIQNLCRTFLREHDLGDLKDYINIKFEKGKYVIQANLRYEIEL